MTIEWLTHEITVREMLLSARARDGDVQAMLDLMRLRCAGELPEEYVLNMTSTAFIALIDQMTAAFPRVTPKEESLIAMLRRVRGGQ